MRARKRVKFKEKRMIKMDQNEYNVDLCSTLQTKTDQAGERLSDPKHIYANPLQPEISLLQSTLHAPHQRHQTIYSLAKIKRPGLDIAWQVQLQVSKLQVPLMRPTKNHTTDVTRQGSLVE